MNNDLIIKFKILNEFGILPIKGSSLAAAYDLFSSEEVILKSKSTEKIKLGFSIEMPENICFLILSRSGLASKGIIVTNSPGLIDPDYRGEVCVLLTNQTNEDFIISRGTKIAQGMFQNILNESFLIGENLTLTERGEGGFGSTGLK